MENVGKSPATVGVFLALSLVWGASFLFIKVGLQGLSPAQVVLGRILLGAIALAVIMLVTRRRWPREPRVWAHMVVVGAFFCAIPFSLFAWAEQFLPSSLASIYNATTPIMTLLLTPLVLRSERLDRSRTMGLVIGIVGVVVLSGPWQLIGAADLRTTLPAQLACLGATVSYGFAGLYLRRFVSGLPYDSVTLSSVQLTMASGVVLLLAPFTTRGPVSLTLPVVLSVSALGVLGTGIAYIWFTRVIRAWGPVRASTVTYLAPVIGVALGVLVLGEGIHWYEPVGGAIVIAGILVSQGVLVRRTARAAADPVSADVS
ncbi:DMT family transporter [Microbacterium capsulatum]|uniref:DMT family transporter n=1 Tax=Microbacterium capsulatum TaxID=3041921 RepID=A0ABU0XI99_9MICO|nr:DMT family transporter [Microbacterium sp. ASV81]MDQ4214846.1 DMT family transporter [Microbacterium sp. ASV81]